MNKNVFLDNEILALINTLIFIGNYALSIYNQFHMHLFVHEIKFKSIFYFHL